MTKRDRCVSCGAGLAPGSRFCRGCGAAMERTTNAVATERFAEAAVGATAACTSCGRPVDPGAVFCRNCGIRLSQQQQQQQVAPPPIPAVSTEERGGRNVALVVGAVVACVLLGGSVAGGVYLLTREDQPADVIAKAPVPLEAPPASKPAASASEEPEPEPEAAERTPPQLEAAGTVSELNPGRYVQAGSFRSAEGAQREVERLRGYGIDATSVPAEWANELLPGFWVLIVGPLEAGNEEQLVLHQLTRANVSGFGRDLTPSTELSGPAAAAGSWGGKVERSYFKGARRAATYWIEVVIAADGESGTIGYPERGCHGTLSLIEDAGYSLAYGESIDSGECPSGGVWHMRPTDAGLTAVWLSDTHEFMVQGKVPARAG